MTVDGLVEIVCGLAGLVFFITGLKAIAESSDRARHRRMVRK